MTRVRFAPLCRRCQPAVSLHETLPGMIHCSRCRNTGHIGLGTSRRPCPTCKTLGWVDCPVCEGEGVMLDPDRKPDGRPRRRLLPRRHHRRVHRGWRWPF